jgi:transcriptional regulator with XRE-family HTH domain
MTSKDTGRANRIIKIFNETGLNQRQFSEAIGVSQQLISTIITGSKRPNQTILFAIIDNIKNIDPLWLLTGEGNEKSNYVPPIENSPPIEFHIHNIVEKRFEELSKEILQRLSNIEESVRESTVKNILRRIDQDNSKLKSDSKKEIDELRG